VIEGETGEIWRDGCDAVVIAGLVKGECPRGCGREIKVVLSAGESGATIAASTQELRTTGGVGREAASVVGIGVNELPDGASDTGCVPTLLTVGIDCTEGEREPP
jgi:hypothetical protein